MPLEHDHMQLTLIDPDRSLDELHPDRFDQPARTGLASGADPGDAGAHSPGKDAAPPALILITGWQTPGGMTTQAGIFGTGNGGKMNQWSFRDDISAQFVWQLDSFGFGNLALIKRRRGEQSQATAELFQMQDRVAAEITRPRPTSSRRRPASCRPNARCASGLITYQQELRGPAAKPSGSRTSWNRSIGRRKWSTPSSC